MDHSILPKILAASAHDCSVHVVGRSVARFNDGIAELVVGPHFGESLHRLMAQRRFRLALLVVVRVIVDIRQTHGEQLQRQLEELRRCLAEIKTFKNFEETRETTFRK